MRFPVYMCFAGDVPIHHHETCANSHDVTERFKAAFPQTYLSGVSRRHLLPFDVIDSHGLKFGFHFEGRALRRGM